MQQQQYQLCFFCFVFALASHVKYCIPSHDLACYASRWVLWQLCTRFFFMQFHQFFHTPVCSQVSKYHPLVMANKQHSTVSQTRQAEWRRPCVCVCICPFRGNTTREGAKGQENLKILSSYMCHHWFDVIRFDVITERTSCKWGWTNQSTYKYFLNWWANNFMFTS